MDLENNNEADALLKKKTPAKRRGLALTLAVALCAAALCAVYMPRANNGSAKLEEVATAPMMDWRAAAVAPAPRAKLVMLEDAAHMTIFSHPTRIAEAVDELWGGALRYEGEL